MGDKIKWVDPWWSTANQNENFHTTFKRQLELEVSSGHQLHNLEVMIIGRGPGDDALFKILDGSGRVAVVHLTWSTNQQPLPWPNTVIYNNLEDWYDKCLIPEYYKLLGVDGNLSEFDMRVISLGLHDLDTSDFEKWVYEHEEIKKEIGEELYLELIACDFLNPIKPVDTLNSWYRKRFSNYNFDLRELYLKYR